MHLIAEACTNHNGSLAKGIELIDIAVAAGAQSVKFQMINPEELYLLRVKDEKGAWTDNAVVAARRAAMLKDDEYLQLATHAKDRAISISASIFGSKSLALACAMGAPYIKIASTDCNNYPLLSEVAATGRKVVLATGMASLGEVEKAIQTINAAGNQDIVLLHCVSVYPCPPELANLPFISTLKAAFGLPVGFSDHTSDSVAAIAALALGAEWFEKHFTWDRAAEGFDHANSLNGEQFKKYADDLHAAEAALSIRAKVGDREAGTRARARRSLYAARDLAPGEVISKTDVLIVRPEGPLSPGDLPLVMGRPLQKAISQYEAFSLEHF